MKRIGLYFGTFNPIHIGHLAIANHMAEFSDLDAVWMVITPHNPFKKKSSLLADHHRYQMVLRACEDYPNIKPSNIEFNLPQPNYTVNTLAHLSEKHPDNQFSLIMGEDNLNTFHKWKNYEVILKHHDLYIYPRTTNNKAELKIKNYEKIHFVNAPSMGISSTFIRKAIKEDKNIRPLVPEVVWHYIDEMRFYK